MLASGASGVVDFEEVGEESVESSVDEAVELDAVGFAFEGVGVSVRLAGTVDCESEEDEEEEEADAGDEVDSDSRVLANEVADVASESVCEACSLVCEASALDSDHCVEVSSEESSVCVVVPLCSEVSVGEGASVGHGALGPNSRIK